MIEFVGNSSRENHTNELRFGAVNRSQKTFQFTGVYINIIIRPHKPFEMVNIVFVHVIKHAKRFLLRWITIIDAFQRDNGHACANEKRISTINFAIYFQ